MAYDNLCKSLIESNPQPFVAWLLGYSVADITILKTELSVEPIRADFVSFLQVGTDILHIEFQTQADPEMPLRMLDYYVRLHRKYRCSVRQIVIFLLPSGSEAVQVDYFATATTQHRYQVVRLWETEASGLLASPSLWPLAVLAQSADPEGILRQVAEGLEQLPEREERVNLAAYTYILGGLRFRKELLQQLLREDVMRESVTYRDLVETSEKRGEQRGIERGIERGRQEGRQEGLRQEALSLTLRLVRYKFGSITESVIPKIEALSLMQLESLAEALLDLQTLEQLVKWLEHPPV